MKLTLKTSAAPTGDCCDNCLRKTDPEHPLLLKRAPALDRPGSPASDTEDSPGQQPDTNGKRGMNEAATVPDRREEHLKGARTRLDGWRTQTWVELYRRRPWGPTVLLPDKVLTALASKARFASVDDLIGAGWSATHARKHGTAVLAMLHEYDELFREFKAAEKEESSRLRKEQTLADRAAKKVQAKAIKDAAAALRESTPKPARPSRAKKAKTQQENIPPSPGAIFLYNPHSIPTASPHTPLALSTHITPQFTPQHAQSPMPALYSSVYMHSTPVQRGFYTSPATQVPNLMASYQHYSPTLHPPRHLQPTHPSLTQNPANVPESPSHFYAPPPQRPKPRPAYMGATNAPAAREL
jgi:hypothetical protein